MRVFVCLCVVCESMRVSVLFESVCVFCMRVSVCVCERECVCVRESVCVRVCECCV